MTVQLTLDLAGRPALGREDFLVAPCNETAVAWIDRWPEWPGQVLALHGPPGAGKTHLAKVWQAMSGAEEVTPEALLASGFNPLEGAACRSFEDGDRHLAESGQGAELERGLLHLVNATRERGGQLLLTGRAAAAQWRCDLADLRSRLGAVQSVRLGPPDDLLLQALLVKLFADRQIRPAPEVLSYLVARMERSHSAARALVEAIDRESLRAKRPVTLPLARAALAELSGEEPQQT
ncbi:MAG: chromosomal replication initiator DnaA [Rhodovibrionaceae bacterium]